ncbi:hypothetical protein [Fictibacillus gelatini]|nr:hypothetical protein [Fictibacillus gelatini]
MKPTTAYALIWLSVAIPVSVGIIVTKSLVPLWALIIPGCISIKEGD